MQTQQTAGERPQCEHFALDTSGYPKRILQPHWQSDEAILLIRVWVETGAAMTSDGLGIDRAVPSESGTGVRGQSPVELSTSLDRTEYGSGLAHSGRAPSVAWPH